jgi:hypothetical protein
MGVGRSLTIFSKSFSGVRAAKGVPPASIS